MKITKVEIQPFKNLSSLNLDFSSNNGLTLLIGNNASGKSNFIELLSDIFYNQYEGKQPTIEYKLEYNDFNGRPQNISSQNISQTLPKRVVAVYSGDSDKLWKSYYEKIYLKYIEGINKSIVLEYPKMFYVNKFYWSIGLISLLLSESDDVKLFIKDYLGISKVNLIKFKFFPNRYENYNNSPSLAFIKKIDAKSEYTLEEFKDLLKGDFSASDFSNDFNTGYNPDEVFRALYIAFTPKDKKIVDDIDVIFNDGITVNDLSEGQKKMLLLKATLEYASSEDTLILLDEPDAHIHLKNKKLIYDLISPYAENRHIIVTSHSPTFTKLFPSTSIVCFENGNLKPQSNTIEASKYLASSEDIYKLLFSQSNILIVEGKTDDKYISKAISLFQTDYPTLSLQILRVGGTDDENIKNLISSIELRENQKILVLVDRDEAGYNVYKKLFPLQPPKTNFKARKDIVIETISPNAIFLMIPHKNKPDNDGDFLVEDYFKKEKILELAKNHIDARFVSDTPCKNFPDVRKTIKEELLPNFCDNSTAIDMEDFKVLLNKIVEALN